MRTYLTRLTMTAAVAVFTGVSLAGVAHAGEGEDYAFVDSSVLDGLETLEPCDEINASDKMALPVVPGEPGDLLPPTEPENPWGDLELVPCYQIPTAPGDDGEEPGNDDDGDNDGQEPGDGGNGGSSGGGQGGHGNGGSNGQSGGGPSGDPSDGVGDDGSANAAGDDTSEAPEIVNPTAATGNDDSGALMLAVLAGVLGALGLFLLTYGLRKRPRRRQQPAR